MQFYVLFEPFSVISYGCPVIFEKLSWLTCLCSTKQPALAGQLTAASYSFSQRNTPTRTVSASRSKLGQHCAWLLFYADLSFWIVLASGTRTGAASSSAWDCISSVSCPRVLYLASDTKISDRARSCAYWSPLCVIAAVAKTLWDILCFWTASVCSGTD